MGELLNTVADTPRCSAAQQPVPQAALIVALRLNEDAGAPQLRFGISSTPWAPSSIACACRTCGLMEPLSSSSPITCRPVLRLAAMMDQPAPSSSTPTIRLPRRRRTNPSADRASHVLAGDSTGCLFRPADAPTRWPTSRYIMPLQKVPVAMALTRQAVPTFDRANMRLRRVLPRAHTSSLIPALGPMPSVIGPAGGSALHCGSREAKLPRASEPTLSPCPAGGCLRSNRPSTAARSSRRKSGREITVEAGTDLGWSQYVGPDGEAVARTDSAHRAPTRNC